MFKQNELLIYTRPDGKREPCRFFTKGIVSGCVVVWFLNSQGSPTSGDGLTVPTNKLQSAEEVARGNIERHLGDVASDYESEEAAADAIYDEAYTLGFDALADVGVDHASARQVADSIARCFAQP